MPRIGRRRFIFSRAATLLLLLLPTACSGVPASPAVAADCDRFTDYEVERTLSFAQRHNSWADWPMPERVPEIEYWPAARLSRLPGAHAADGEVMGALVRDRNGGVRVVVVYRHELDGEMYGILAHELVHFLQHNAGDAWPLPEGPANISQGTYLGAYKMFLPDAPQ